MNKLGAIKYLKERGASYRMMDDVSDFVGGYDSPLFIPTIEFIIDMNKALSMDTPLKSAGLGMSSEQKKANNPPLEYNPVYFSVVSLEAAREHAKNMAAVSTGTELEQQIQAVEYLEDMIIQENEHMKTLGLDAADNMKGKKSSHNYNKKQKIAQRMADKIRREMDSFMSYLQDVTKSSQRNKKNAVITGDTHNRQQGQQQTQQVQQNLQQQSVRESRRRSSRSSRVVTSVFNVLNTMRNVVSSRTQNGQQTSSTQSNSQKRTQQLLEKIDSQHHEHHHHEVKDIAKAQVQQDKPVQREYSRRDRRSSETKDSQKESIASKAIDKVIKDNKDEKRNQSDKETKKLDEKKVEEKKPDSQDMKFSKGVESRAPKYDEAKVAKMDMKEAMKTLKDVGVRSDSNPSIGDAAKAALDSQLKNNKTADSTNQIGVKTEVKTR